MPPGADDMDSEFIESQLQQAGDLLDQGKAAEALAHLENVDSQFADDELRIEHAALTAWALSELDRSAEAADLLRPLLEEHPDSARLLGTYGIVLSGLNRLEEACEALERAAVADSEDGAILANLGYVHERFKEFAAAARYYEKALNLGADVVWVLRRLAAVQRDMDDLAAARGTLRRYLSLAPEDAAEWISLAIIHSELEDYDASIQCYQRAESLDADARSLHYNWGLTAQRAGRMDEASKHLDELTRIAPDSPQCSILRAFMLEQEGHLEAAYRAHLEALDRVTDEDPDEVAYAYETAMDFCADHKLRDEAEKLIDRAYAANACSVDLCEAYREVAGERLDKGYWFSVIVEADYRSTNGKGVNGHGGNGAVKNGDGASTTLDTAPAKPSAPIDGGRPANTSGPTRFIRNYQVVAKDHDHAIGMLADFLKRMGESHASVSEFIDEESIEDVFSGIYEVEPERTILGVDGAV